MQNYYQESFGAPKKAKAKELAASGHESNNGKKTGEHSMLPASLMTAIALTPAPASTSSQPAVFFAESGKEAAWDDVDSILELAEQEGIKIRSSCKQGVCGACKKRKLEGEVKYESVPDALDQEEQEAGYILPCIASPVGRVVIEA